MKISELNKRFISYCVRNRLGRTNFGVRVIYFITNILGRFETYKNTQEFNKRGHYVPKLLLRRFRLAEKGSLKGKINELTPENANHEITFFEDADYFVDAISKVDQPTKTVLRSKKNGKIWSFPKL